MDNTSAGSNLCELGVFFRDVHELQVGLREVRDAVSNLRVVAQEEQGRSTEIEAAAKADHVLLVETGERVADLKRQVEQALFVGHSACKDVAAVSGQVHDARNRLGDQEGQLAAALMSIEELRGALKSSSADLAAAGGRAADAHARLDAVHRDLRLHAEELGSGGSSVACLEERLSAAEAEAQRLAAAHGETAGALRGLAESTVRRALERAGEDRACLRALEARAAALEARRAGSDEHAAQLAAGGRAAAADLRALQDRVGELAAAARLVQEQLAQTRAELEAERERGDGARRSIRALQEGSQSFNAALHRTHDEVTGVLRDGRQRAEQIHCLADDLAALGHGLEITDGEVCSLQALLEGVPSGAQR